MQTVEKNTILYQKAQENHESILSENYENIIRATKALGSNPSI